jgi:hypothetical protein
MENLAYSYPRADHKLLVSKRLAALLLKDIFNKNRPLTVTFRSMARLMLVEPSFEYMTNLA